MRKGASAARTDVVPSFLNGRQLRDYQRESLKWMMANFRVQKNCILGDEMVRPQACMTFTPCLVFMHMAIERALYTSCSEDAVKWGAFGVWIKCMFSQANIVLLMRMCMPRAHCLMLT